MGDSGEVMPCGSMAPPVQMVCGEEMQKPVPVLFQLEITPQVTADRGAVEPVPVAALVMWLVGVALTNTNEPGPKTPVSWSGPEVGERELDDRGLGHRDRAAARVVDLLDAPDGGGRRLDRRAQGGRVLEAVSRLAVRRLRVVDLHHGERRRGKGNERGDEQEISDSH